MIYGCGRCGGDLPLNTNLAHCMACHLTFGSARGFDEHRVGGDDNRRCLTPAQLNARNYSPNERGAWRVPRDGDLSALSGDGVTAREGSDGPA